MSGLGLELGVRSSRVALSTRAGTKRRELLAVAALLLLPIPLLVLSGVGIPLPSVIERGLASLIPGVSPETKPALAPVGAKDVAGRVQIRTDARLGTAASAARNTVRPVTRTAASPAGIGHAAGGAGRDGAPAADAGPQVVPGAGGGAAGSGAGGPSVVVSGTGGAAGANASVDAGSNGVSAGASVGTSGSGTGVSAGVTVPSGASTAVSVDGSGAGVSVSAPAGASVGASTSAAGASGSVSVPGVGSSPAGVTVPSNGDPPTAKLPGLP